MRLLALLHGSVSGRAPVANQVGAAVVGYVAFDISELIFDDIQAVGYELRCGLCCLIAFYHIALVVDIKQGVEYVLGSLRRLVGHYQIYYGS